MKLKGRLFEEAGLYWKSLSNLFFCRRCIICDSVLENDEDYICLGCYAEMPLTYFWSWKDNPAEIILRENVGITSAVSLFFYQDSNNYSLMTQYVKYRGWLAFGHSLGRMLAQKMTESKRFESVDALVPVPLHSFRQFNRGYNQAEVIAKGMQEILKIPIVNLVKRYRSTKSQTTLSNEDKVKNVSGAFKRNEQEIEKTKKSGIKHLMIIDDVLTSGSTISACTSVLINDFDISVATVAFVGEL